VCVWPARLAGDGGRHGAILSGAATGCGGELDRPPVGATRRYLAVLGVASKGARPLLPAQFRAVRFGMSRTFVRGQQKSSADAVTAIVLRFV
jgi:hypothetical protein